MNGLLLIMLGWIVIILLMIHDVLHNIKKDIKSMK